MAIVLMNIKIVKRFAVLLCLLTPIFQPMLRASGELTPVVGYINSDATPASGQVQPQHWGGIGALALDCLRRSVAFDFGTPKVIRSMTLRDSNATTRLVAADYTVWKSNDNLSYTQISGWTLGTETMDGQVVHTFRGPAVTARYVKINNATYADSTNYTFVLPNLAADAIASGTVAGLLNNDTEPATGAVTAWGSTGGVAVDYLRRSVALDFSTSQVIRSLMLIDNNATSRITAANCTLWCSDNNITYQPILGWHLDASVVGGALVHTFVGFEVTARYVKINSTFDDSSGYTFILSNLQKDLMSFDVAPLDFGVSLHSDGDQLFPPGTLAFENGEQYRRYPGVSAAEAFAEIYSDVSAIGNTGIRTLKMNIGFDVLNWKPADTALALNTRDWRLDGSSPADWDATVTSNGEIKYKYAALQGIARTARNVFNAQTPDPSIPGETTNSPLRVAANAAHAKGMRFILSYQIADGHFADDPDGEPLTSKFYIDREDSATPADRVAIKHSGSSPVPGYGHYANAMNFGRDHVRDHRKDVIFAALDEHYDVIDGFEINFTRSLALFPLPVATPQKTVEQVIDGNVEVVTQFLQEVRTHMTNLEATHHKVLAFGLRVPGDQDVCRNQGVDVLQQIRDRRVDYVVASNIMNVAHDMELRPWVAAARPAHAFDPGVEIHSGLPSRKPKGWLFPADSTVPSEYGTANVTAGDVQILGAALTFRRMGADGVELYNFASAGTPRLTKLASELAMTPAAASGLPKIFAVTPMHAPGPFYEGRLEYIKRLPAEFRADGTVYANSIDGTLAWQAGNRHTSHLFITGRTNQSGGSATDQWFLRLGIREIPGATYDPSHVSLHITINGSCVFNGQLETVSLGNAGAPAPRDYVIIPVPQTFPLKDGEMNVVVISQNAIAVNGGAPTRLPFRLQEIQMGVFP